MKEIKKEKSDKKNLIRNTKLVRPRSIMASAKHAHHTPPEFAAVKPEQRIAQMFTTEKPTQKKWDARPLVKKGLTCNQLYAKARGQQLELSAGVVIKNAKRMYNKQTSNPSIVAITYSRKTNGKTGLDKYITYVEAQNCKTDKFSETKVLVGCSCPFHLFWSEVALTKAGASRIQFSNGEDPVVRNSKEKPWACKHTLALIDRILDKGV